MPWIFLHKKYNIPLDYITEKNHNILNSNCLQKKYPKAQEEIERLKKIYTPCVFSRLTIEHEWDNEYLNKYKELISKYPVDKIKVRFNRVSTKDYNNYALYFPWQYDPRGKGYHGTSKLFAEIPNMVFPKKSNYCLSDKDYPGSYGFWESEWCDVDGKLFEYCKNKIK